MPKKTYFKNKRVLIRADFNVEIESNRVVDDFKIVRALKTIKYVNSQSRYVLLVSHLGNPKEGGRLDSLAPVAKYLSKLLNKKVYFVFDRLEQLEQSLSGLPKGSVVLLENIRFYSGEYSESGYVNSVSFSKKLASLADCYINEAFGESHRKVSSLVGITKYLPSFAGFNLVEEIKNLDRIKKGFKKPLVIILGGSKLKTKLPLIKSFIKQADQILLGGALANTFLRSLGLEIGRSVFEKDFLKQASRLAELKQVYLPIDFAIAKSKNSKKFRLTDNQLPATDYLLDLGPETIRQYQKIIKSAGMILWNGPMGYYENPVFSLGTKEIAKAIFANKKAFKVIGGGDTAAFLRKAEFPISNSQFLNTFISTGGGAMLEYLAGKKLPGIETLNY
ncbi:MAG: phosphoglycerate kinase [Patescibacteria group bacterium]